MELKKLKSMLKSRKKSLDSLPSKLRENKISFVRAMNKMKDLKEQISFIEFLIEEYNKTQQKNEMD